MVQMHVGPFRRVSRFGEINVVDPHTKKQGMQITMASQNNKKKDNSEEGKVVDGPRLAKAKSERKRSKEQERRNALNEGLDRLTELVFLVDPQLKAMAETRAAKNNKTPSSEQLLSRVELMNSAVSTFARLHQENERNKAALAHIMTGGRVIPNGFGMNPAYYQSDANNQSRTEGTNGSARSQTAKDASLVRPPSYTPAPPTFGGLAASSAGHPLLPPQVGLTSHANRQGMRGGTGPVPKSGIGESDEGSKASIQNNTMGSSGRSTSEEAVAETKEDDQPTPRKRRKKREKTG